MTSLAEAVKRRVTELQRLKNQERTEDVSHLEDAISSPLSIGELKAFSNETLKAKEKHPDDDDDFARGETKRANVAEAKEKHSDDDEAAFARYCEAKRANVEKIKPTDDAHAIRILRNCWAATSLEEKTTYYKKRKYDDVASASQDTGHSVPPLDGSDRGAITNPFTRFEEWPDYVLDVIINAGQFVSEPLTQSAKIAVIRKYLFSC